MGQSREAVNQLTQLLRQSEESFWQRIRGCLAQKGIDVSRSWLADSWPEDNRFDLGYLVTPTGIYRFGFDWTQGEDEGVITEWVQLRSDEELKTDTEWVIAKESITAARELLEESRD